VKPLGLTDSILNKQDAGRMLKFRNCRIDFDEVSKAFTKHYGIVLLYINTTEVVLSCRGLHMRNNWFWIG
jgi:hypothetical protein